MYADFQAQGLMLPYYQQPIGGLGAHAGTACSLVLVYEPCTLASLRRSCYVLKESLLQVELR